MMRGIEKEKLQGGEEYDGCSLKVEYEKIEDKDLNGANMIKKCENC